MNSRFSSLMIFIKEKKKELFGETETILLPWIKQLRFVGCLAKVCQCIQFVDVNWSVFQTGKPFVIHCRISHNNINENSKKSFYLWRICPVQAHDIKYIALRRHILLRQTYELDYELRRTSIHTHIILKGVVCRMSRCCPKSKVQEDVNSNHSWIS